MAKTTEVIVSTENVSESSELAASVARSLESLFSEFTGTLDLVCMNSIISGETHEQLKLFNQYAKELHGQFSAIAYKISSNNTQFLARVDADDQYLY